MDTFEPEEEVGHEEEKVVEKEERIGLIVREDDLEVGQLLCVHSIKGEAGATSIMGQPLKVKAICLPFLVAEFLLNNEPLTLDVRYLKFMRITEEFAAAQKARVQKKGPQA